ncbi:MAG TPA: DUF924 family protein [Steroidobacteraceae bacterium]|nr:DUF924 family protein [Steroidobacteraceae bacterium]
MDEARQVRDFWFGKLPMTAQTLDQRLKFWFPEDEAPVVRQNRDKTIRARFGSLVERAMQGELASWADSPRRCLSLLILLDQFPRNIYRGTARAFAGDDQAVAITLSGMESAADGALDLVERIFFYMPLQHCEVREVQEESVAAYRRLLAEAPQDLRGAFEDALKAAEEHRTIVERFGRFPHRNRALERVSTREEEAWLGAGGE